MARRERRLRESALIDVSSEKDPAAAVALARELLDTGRLPEETTRAELLRQMGRMLRAAGDLEQAEAALREAVLDGGATHGDPRIPLADVVARRGDRPACDVLLAEIWRERPTDPWVYHEVAEVLRLLGDTTTALRWANTGAFRLIRLDEELPEEALALLASRYQLRLEVGFTEDEYDLLAAEWLAEDDGYDDADWADD